MNRIYTLLLIFLLSYSLHATEYAKIWVNGEESSTVNQGDQFAWEFDLSVNGGTATIQLILDINENEVFDESDIVLIEFPQKDGTEGNDGPGDADGEENGIVYSPLGAFGFAPAYYLLSITDNNDQSKKSAAFHVNALAEPAATVHGSISKADVAPPSSELQNIMVLAQLNEGFAGFWTGLSDNQGNYTINLPDTAVGTVWNIELFNDDHGMYVADDHYEEVTIHAGANTGFNFHFDLPSSYVYGKLMDELGYDIFVNDYIHLENIYSNDRFDTEIRDGKFNIPITFPPGQNSAQFRINFRGDSIPPDYMVPQTWENEDFLITVNEGDSLEKNITLQRTDQEIYVQILMEGTAPGMAFEVEAYDNQGYTQTLTNDDGWGVLSVKGTGYYWVMIRFDNQDLQPLPSGYTFDGGHNSNGVAGDTVKFNIIKATSAISGSITFAEGDPTDAFDGNDFFVEIEENSWSSRLTADFSDSLNYHFDLSDGTYYVWLNSNDDNYLAFPNSYHDLKIDSDSLNNIDFELNYCHANIFLKLKNAVMIDPTHYQMGIRTAGDWPNTYQTWGNGDQDSTFHFKVCEGSWTIEIPEADTALTVEVSDEGINYYVVYDYKSGNVTTGLKETKQVVQSYQLLQNYPNPFNPQTTIDYQLAKSGKVNLTIYDIVGREVRTLVNGFQTAGSYTIHFDGVDLPSGLYFYKLMTSGGYIETRKMMLVK